MTRKNDPSKAAAEPLPAPQKSPEPPANRFEVQQARLKFIIGFVGVILLAILLALLNYNGFQRTILHITPTFTSRPPTLTPTPRPTGTPTQPPTSTPTATATFTAMPPSAYLVGDAALIDPPIAGVNGGVFVLNENTSLTADPDFLSACWESSDQIGAQFGLEIVEPYLATFCPATVQWSMDVPLPAGLYEIHILDTLYSSAGPLDFQVKLGENPLTALVGMTRVNFLSRQGNPPQYVDQWHSIGVYSLDRPELLSVSSSWDQRDEFSIVAVDRVAVVPLHPANATLISQLPAGYQAFIMDDAAALVESAQSILGVTDQPAWGGSYEMIVNPDDTTRVTWEYPDLLPTGNYAVLVWVPTVSGETQVTYRVFVNNIEVNANETDAPMQFAQSQYTGGQWVSLGLWQLPALYGDWVSLKVEMVPVPGTLGEVAADAVAFVRGP